MSQLGHVGFPYPRGSVVIMSPDEEWLVGDILEKDEGDDYQPYLYDLIDLKTGKREPDTEDEDNFATGCWMPPGYEIRRATDDELKFLEP